jgi:Tol biopolymer transport system component
MDRGALNADGSVRAIATGMNGPFDVTGVQVVDVRHGGSEHISVGEHGRWVAAREPDIDLAGRTVVFSSEQGLDPADANGIADVYVRDRRCPVAQRVSVGTPHDARSVAPAISGDGRWIAFISDGGDGGDTVFVVDRVTGAMTVAARGGSSWGPAAFSADGRFVAFDTTARLTADDRDAGADIYVRDLVGGGIERIPLAPGKPFSAPSLSADGRFVVAAEYNGSEVWRHDRSTGRSELVSTWPTGPGAGFDPALSADGSRVAFVGDADPAYWPDEHGDTDIWVRDMTAGTTRRVRPATTPPGPHFLPDISADGRWISYATRTTDGGIYDLGTARPVPAAVPFDGRCFSPQPATPYEQAVLADEPVGYWPLGDGADALVARDELQFLDARPSGTIRRAVPGAVAGDSAYDFAGAGHLTLTANVEFPGRAPFTLEAWIAPRDLGAQTRRIFSMESADSGANGNRGYLLGVRADGLYFQRYIVGRATAVRAPMDENVWSHVVATYDGDVMRLYVDGVERAATRSAFALLPARNPATVGAKQGRWLRYRGRLDELAVYPRALAPERVAAHYRLAAR